MAASDFPSIEPNNINLINTIPTQINRTLSGREMRDIVGAPYYTLTYEFTNLSEAQRRQILGHIANARGTLQSFNIKLPTGLDDASGGANGTIAITSAESAGVLSVDYSKASSANETVFKAGDYIQFSNHSKIYEVIEDSVSTTTTGTVTFYPPLRTAVTTSDTIGYQNLEVRARYAADPSTEVRNNTFATVSLELIEVFE